MFFPGTYTTALPYALRPEHFEAIRNNLDRLEWRCQSLEDYLAAAPPHSIDRFNLSDIFEYMSEHSYTDLLRRLVAAGRPGGRLVYWNMLVPRSRPDALADRLVPLADLAARLATELRDGLTGSGRYRAIGLDCNGKPCTAGDTDVEDLAAKAHTAGAGIMLFGRIEKQSTLISWARVRAINTATGAVLFDKFLSFRGDDDAAWQHLETFVLRDFLAAGVGS